MVRIGARFFVRAHVWSPLWKYPARVCKGKRIRSKLVGPFVTEPGQWASIVVELPGLLDDGDRIISFVGDIMGRDGRAVRQ